MPFKGEIASGDSLITIANSKVLADFKGKIKPLEERVQTYQIDQLILQRGKKKIEHVFVLDGSIISHRIENGFPGAEVSLLQVALVILDLSKLDVSSQSSVIPPNTFQEMEKVVPLQAVLPGCNVISDKEEPPLNFLRSSVYNLFLNCKIDDNHETLLETFLSVMEKKSTTKMKCPIYKCGQEIFMDNNTDTCPMCKGQLYPTDRLRFSELFNDLSTNFGCHAQIMNAIELFVLINILRFFCTEENKEVLRTVAFVKDGPLAAFGQLATTVPQIRSELKRLNMKTRALIDEDIILFSIVKTGAMVEHLEYLDFCENNGPNKKFPPQTVLCPSIKYIHENIVFREIPLSMSDHCWGENPPQYFGRVVFYKSKSEKLLTINIARLNDICDDLFNTTKDAYPRLEEILDICDELSSYLFENGFIPLIRAHSHAAIPFKRGTQILEELFK